jgi:hypothetical protein
MQNERDRPVIEVTPAMIEAGVAVLRRFDPNSDMLDLVVEEIIAQSLVAAGAEF